MTHSRFRVRHLHIKSDWLSANWASSWIKSRSCMCGCGCGCIRVGVHPHRRATSLTRMYVCISYTRALADWYSRVRTRILAACKYTKHPCKCNLHISNYFEERAKWNVTGPYLFRELYALRLHPASCTGFIGPGKQSNRQYSNADRNRIHRPG